ncbi:HK97-gp10 family putative phage morphogenesis protein [Cytobacillus oceanisediminis]|uniref:HK97-gp10 family putative phage morphogenesis protein n=1 Tax=Cytobacillus oceanisediminis TaxID=665099 RepID=UPI00207A8269|nr:HK97-gp10 family putative phage morphogenesis protein [Cytobacillus oceanisediminis]USK43725.1 hypothetical protein LIT27_24620 [Cytobacillus oceanisediminis]
MSVNITGINALINELERRLGQNRMQEINDRALKEGAKVFVRELKLQFEHFKDTGASIDEITISEPMWVRGKRTIKVHWRGPKGRYRIIHLNEWGTVENPNPRGKGVIARALRNAEEEYRRVVRQALERGI